jgi:hypothetical protein
MVTRVPEYSVEESDLGLPDEEVMACEDGLVENHHYRDLRWIDIDDYDRWAAFEQDLLDYEFDLGDDEAAEDFEDNEVYFTDIDPGVATTVAALAAAGCCPVTSCSGSSGHYESHPLVLAWVPIHAWPLIEGAAVEEEVCLTGVGGAVLVWHWDDIEKMRAFARNLAQRVRSAG